ncbi:MAG: acyl carrier protein [Eubacterium sp.]
MEFEKLVKAITDVLDIAPDEITEDTEFVNDLGADSLDVAEIIMSIEDEFKIRIPDNELESIVTVGEAVEKIKNEINK